MRKAFGIFVTGLLMLAIGACESIDCTLNNVVMLNVGFYDSQTGNSYAFTDTLTVTAQGTDSVLYNRGIRQTAITLPMSYWQEADTLTFSFYKWEYDLSYDVVLRVQKTNFQHFESPDCPTTMFHTLTAIDYDDADSYVDSIVIANTAVNYASLENIKIYLHTDD
ncbi:MAG: hypothetical protein IJ064_07015 [Bacteroidaceae bacterium]|nr:hypothetical protein [Bacteroidaceae bacterium]